MFRKKRGIQGARSNIMQVLCGHVFSHVHSAMYTGLTRSFLVPPQVLCTHVSDTNLALSYHWVGRPLGVKVCRPVSLYICLSYRELHLCMPKSLSTGLDLHILKHKVVRPFTKFVQRSQTK